MKTSILPLAGALGAALAAFLPLSLHAANPEAESIVVTATRTAQLADEVLSPTIVISREEIERSQAVDVADLLRFHAGLDIGRSGGAGQQTSVFLRGTNSNHTLVLIDGVRINPATIGGAALQNLDPAMIERIEIVKGPRSSLYGSDAIGGVINIITRRAAAGTQAHVSSRFGTYGTQKFSAGAQHARGGARFGIDVSSLSTDGFPTRVGSDIDRGHDKDSVSVHAGHRFDAIDVELSHFQARGNTEYLDFFLDPLDQGFHNSVSALKLEANLSAHWATGLHLSRTRDEIDQNQSDGFAHTERHMIDWQNDVQVGESHLLTGGIHLWRDDATALVFGTGFDERIYTRAVYLQDVIEQGAHRGLVAARYTDHDAFGGHTTWDAEYGYWLSEATRLSAGVGTAFRAPDATDRFGFGGNPDLDPEKSRNFEIGVRHRLSPTQRVSLQIFHNDIENLIQFDSANNQMTNIGEARISGIEAGYEYAAGPWRAGVEAIVQDPENRDTGDQLARRAKQSLTAALDYRIERYQLGADILVTSSRRDTAFNDVDLSGYGLTNLTAAWHLSRDWVLRGRVENLFDRDYALAGGFNTPGRSYLVQLAWQYQAREGQ